MIISIHIVVVILVFPNPRLLLPALLVSSFGWHYVVQKLLPVVLLFGLYNHANLEENTDWEVFHSLSKNPLLQDKRVLSSSPSVYTNQGSTIVSSIPLREVETPHLIDPKMLVEWAQRNQVTTVVIREQDCLTHYRALIHLFRQPLPPNVALLDCLSQWCVFDLGLDSVE